MTTKILGLSGSLRKKSHNRLLLRNAADILSGTYTEADLNFPLYNGDDEDASGVPEAVQNVADQISAADAILISTPEYNGSISGVLKNALDWVSRTKGGVWHDKPVAIMSAAAGRTGGALAQYSLRSAMVPFRARLVNGPQVMIANSGSEFDENGVLASERYRNTLTDLMDVLRAEIR